MGCGVSLMVVYDILAGFLLVFGLFLARLAGILTDPPPIFETGRANPYYSPVPLTRVFIGVRMGKRGRYGRLRESDRGLRKGI